MDYFPTPEQYIPYQLWVHCKRCNERLEPLTECAKCKTITLNELASGNES